MKYTCKYCKYVSKTCPLQELRDHKCSQCGRGWDETSCWWAAGHIKTEFPIGIWLCDNCMPNTPLITFIGHCEGRREVRRRRRVIL